MKNKRTGIANILKVYEQATEIEKISGLNWYLLARAYCAEAAAKFNVPLDIAIAVLASLSPRNKWKQNLKDLVTVLQASSQGQGPESVRVGTFTKNKEKAFAILRENNPSLAYTSKKVRSFCHNIAYTESKEVTVDVHAFSIYMGKRSEPWSLTDTDYDTIASAHKIAAKKVGLRPYELQAICWVTWIRLTKSHRVEKLKRQPAIPLKIAA